MSNQTIYVDFWLGRWRLGEPRIEYAYTVWRRVGEKSQSTGVTNAYATRRALLRHEPHAVTEWPSAAAHLLETCTHTDYACIVLLHMLPCVLREYDAIARHVVISSCSRAVVGRLVNDLTSWRRFAFLHTAHGAKVNVPGVYRALHSLLYENTDKTFAFRHQPRERVAKTQPTTSDSGASFQDTTTTTTTSPNH